ncbi:hypothetical protein PV04_10632 [Phialophora macrospora]|uniref:Uncharacterized protein n=1 Tax=Phialophora macrospora TaxID=1851006 RepID=A0A0D2FR39_9EURO|nr:hypothetical protein PV04_10632 [Phialophora macrospora]
MLYSLIYIGSTTAFNSINAIAILALNVTYAIPQGIVLIYGRDKVLPKRHFNLGPYFGPFCNMFWCLWVSLYTVLFCFPLFIPTTADSMNYVSVVTVGVIVLILFFWYAGKRKTFVGPQVSMEEIEFVQTVITGDDPEAEVQRISELPLPKASS